MKTVIAQIPKKLHKRYKIACSKLGITMRTPIVKAVNATIKEAR
jgi:hypothetical protein